MDTTTPVTNAQTSTVNPPTNITEIPQTPAPKRTRTAKAKPRDLDSLHALPVKSMSDDEKALYIADCRTKLAMTTEQNRCLSENCREAYEKFKEADAECKRIAREANAKLAFCKQSIEVCYRTIALLETKS